MGWSYSQGGTKSLSQNCRQFLLLKCYKYSSKAPFKMSLGFYILTNKKILPIKLLAKTYLSIGMKIYVSLSMTLKLDSVDNGKPFISKRTNCSYHLDLLMVKFLSRTFLHYLIIWHISWMFLRTKLKLHLSQKEIRQIHYLASVRGDHFSVRLWYSVSSSPLSFLWCYNLFFGLDFFFFASINIYLCVWLSPQRCSNICSIIVARSHYLLSTRPCPCGVPQSRACLTAGQRISQCDPICFPLSILVHQTTQIIFEIPG